MIIQEKFKKSYLMVGGTLLPAFIAVLVRASVKNKITFKASDIIIFAGLSVLGGYATSQMLKES